MRESEMATRKTVAGEVLHGVGAVAGGSQWTFQSVRQTSGSMTARSPRGACGF